MNITGTTRVFAVLGDPVAQVRAPEVFNHIFRRHGVDAVLVPVHVAALDLEGFVRHFLKARNMEGLCLSIPHKPLAMTSLDRCDEHGRIAGAVNAVRRHPDGLIEGALFDGLGFAKALDYFGCPVAGARALVVGTGGAGVAIAAELARRGVRELVLFDALPGRAATVAGRIADAYATKISLPSSADPAGCDIVVNSTPLGLRAGDPFPFNPARLDPGCTVVDILMTREPTPLLRACRERGVSAHAGYEMLIQQVPEYLAFFGMPDIALAVQSDAGEVRALLQPK